MIPVGDMSETCTSVGSYTGWSGFVAVFLAAAGLITRWISRRSGRNREIMSRIEETERQLSEALEQGRVSDAHTLALRLDRLWRMYRRAPARKPPPSGAAKAATALAVLMLCCGCGSLRPGKKVEYVVLGERINIVEPGQAVTVPELIPPAKRWYLVDNKALEAWLGVGDRGADVH